MERGEKSRRGCSLLSGQHKGPPFFIFQTREEKVISTFFAAWTFLFVPWTLVVPREDAEFIIRILSN